MKTEIISKIAVLLVGAYFWLIPAPRWQPVLAQGGVEGDVWGWGMPNLGMVPGLPGLSPVWEGASSRTGRGKAPWDQPAACQPTGSGRGWGWRLSLGGSSGCSNLGCSLHPRVAPLLSRTPPGFWGLVGAIGSKRGPLVPRWGAGERGKAYWKGSPRRMPGGALGKKSSCSAYAVEPGQESSHATSHRADFSGC